MRRSAPHYRSAALVGLLLLAGACSSEPGRSTSEARAPVRGSELMAQQAPPQQAPILDLSRDGYYCRDYPYYEDYAPVRDSAGAYPFYWTRGVYSGTGYRRNTWQIDYPKSDQQFLIVIKRLVRLNAYSCQNPVMLSDPDLRKFPLVYMVEVGGMYLSDAEVVALRNYMLAGGFVIIDDFWGQDEWDQFIFNLRRVFPDKSLVDIGLDHPVYSAYYDIDRVEQVPAYGNTYNPKECRDFTPCDPQVKGLYDDHDRLMMIVNFNTDMGDAWEWAEQPSYPLQMSTYAYQMGANMIVYAMSH